MAATTVLVGDDPVLTALVLRVAAAAGRDVEVVPDPASARAAWSLADDVVVLDTAVRGCLEADLRRRAQVTVVSGGDDESVPWRAVLALGADAVVPLPSGEALLLDRLSRPVVPGAGAVVVGVLPGSGGAGASVLAAALCVAVTRRGGSALLLDADPDGPGADLLLGAEDVPGARWPDLVDAGAGLAPETLRSALPSAHGVHVLSVDRGSAATLSPTAAADVLETARRAFDVVVVDLPGGRPEILERLAPACGRVLLVATGDVRGATSASRRAAALRGASSVEVAVRSVPGAGLEGDALAAWLGLPAAAEIPHDRGLLASLDRGDPPGAGARSRIGRVCDALASRLVLP